MNENSNKRNRKIELSQEAIALKKMREFRSMSVRDVGDMLNVSFTTVSHMENGRAKIHETYLKNFLKALKFCEKDFKLFCVPNEKRENIKRKCYQLLEKMGPTELEKVHLILKSF